MTLSDYRSALVTGASSGIGAAVTRALSERGLEVHAAARRKARLDQLAAELGCTGHVVDARNRKAVYAAFEGLEVDILVNNWGSGPGFDRGYEAAPENIAAMLETNVLGTAHVIRAVVPGMTARKRGHIVNIGSIAGLYPMHSSIYGASKAALHMLSQNLRFELQGSGVRVTEICPGQTETEFFEGAFEDAEAKRRYVDGLDGMRLLSPEDVTAAVMFALDAPWHVNVSLLELTPTEQVPAGLSNVVVSSMKSAPS